jgi:hypothetical protein
LAASTSKKVLIQRFDRGPLAGFVNPQSYLQPSGVELLSVSGSVQVVPYEDVKAVCFVRDFDTGDPSREQKTFYTRPKMDGLWVRMRFRDGELREGLMPNNLLQMEPQGFTYVPPNPSSNNQRIFVPKTALTEVQILGVVGSPLRPRKAKPAPKGQIELFE